MIKWSISDDAPKIRRAHLNRKKTLEHIMEKTLFVSDLDGTLLNRQDKISDFTIQTLNRLLDSGLLFTFATARSIHSARKVATGLSPRLPWIVYNGAFIIDASSGERIFQTFFTPEQKEILKEEALRLGLLPLVYAIVDGRERVSFLEHTEPLHPGMAFYLQTRRNDPRMRPVKTVEELYRGESFYMTFIHQQETLAPLWERTKGLRWTNGTFQQELYRQEYWLELTPQLATKARAAERLKESLGCDRLVAFGDAMNDLPLFAAADEGYAVANAMEELKAASTGIIGSNEADGVARFLLERQKQARI